MSRIYLIITLCLFTFLACTNSVNSNNPEIKQEQTAPTEKSVNLENTVGSYKRTEGAGGVEYSSCGKVDFVDIYELNNKKYRCWIHWTRTRHFGGSYCNKTFDLEKIENGKWLSNENGWYIVIPQDGFSEDLSSIVLAYEDSTGQVEAYPFDKVK